MTRSQAFANTGRLYRGATIVDPLYGAVPDGPSGTNNATSIQSALDGNRGKTTIVPAGVFSAAGPIVLGSRVTAGVAGSSAFSYQHLAGEGPAIYADNTTGSGYAHTPQSIIHVTSGTGIKINNSYQRITDLCLIGTQQGGSDPTAAAAGSLKNMGVQLSGGTAAGTEQTDQHGGYSRLENVRVSSFDTGYGNPSAGFLAYDEIVGCDAFSCINGWVIQGSIFDFRISGGKTVSCSGVGMYLWSPGQHGFTITNHFFELCGTAPLGIVNKNSASLVVATNTVAKLVGCTFSDYTSISVLRGARLEMIGCDVQIASKIYGPGELSLGGCVGTPFDVPIEQNMAAWNLTNCTATPVDATGTPHCFKIDSAVTAATQMYADAELPSTLDPRAIDYYATGNGTRHAVLCTFRMKWDISGGKAQAPVPAGSPAQWTRASNFAPLVQVLAYNATSDNWADASASDPSAWDFTDGKWWTVNLYLAIRNQGAYITDMLEKVRVLIQFGDGTDDAYGATPLSLWITPPKLTFFQEPPYT